MKVFYTASFFGKEKYQDWYTLTLAAIKSTKTEILSSEEKNYLQVLKLDQHEKVLSKKKLHYKAIRQGIKWTQAIIVEVSHEDFQLGHEVSVALSLKKPVLALSIHEDFSKKIISPYFFGAKYNEHSVKKLVHDFIRKHEKETLNHRFNLFLSERQAQNLENQAKKLDMNNSEYLRMLIDKN